MKLRHANLNLSITSHCRETYRRCIGRGVFLSTHDSLRAKKLAIRWSQPKSWRVTIRTSSDSEMAEI